MSSDYTEPELAIYRKRLLESIDDPMTVLEANGEAHRLEGIAAYLHRGRRLGYLELDALMWVIKQFQGSLSSDPAGFAYWQAYDDACSEARLRGEEPPFPTPEQWELVQQYLSTRLKDPAVLAIFEAIEGEHIKQVIQTLADPHRRNDEQRNGRLVGRCAAQAPPLTMHLRSHARASWVPLPKVFFSMRIRPIISSFV